MITRPRDWRDRLGLKRKNAPKTASKTTVDGSTRIRVTAYVPRGRHWIEIRKTGDIWASKPYYWVDVGANGEQVCMGLNYSPTPELAEEAAARALGPDIEIRRKFRG
jgi:hypothetical protein